MTEADRAAAIAEARRVCDEIMASVERDPTSVFYWRGNDRVVGDDRWTFYVDNGSWGVTVNQKPKRRG